MSIVALKRNSRRFKAPISGRGKNGFSLCGGTRNQGWVGQGVRGRALGGTPFRGVVPIGNGGCCGKYVVNVVNSAACCTNDASIIKKASINQPGYISRSLTPRSTVPFSREDAPKCCGGGIIWVKGVGNLDQGHTIYTARLTAAASGCITRKPDAGLAGCRTSQPDCCGAKRVIVTFDPELRYYANLQASSGPLSPPIPASIAATILSSEEATQQMVALGVPAEQASAAGVAEGIMLDTKICYSSADCAVGIPAIATGLLVRTTQLLDGVNGGEVVAPGWWIMSGGQVQAPGIGLGNPSYLPLNLASLPPPPPPPAPASITGGKYLPLCPSQPDGAILRSTEGKALVTVTCAAACACPCAFRSHFIGGRKVFVGPYGKDLNMHPVSQGQYVGAGALRKHGLPTPACKAAWPPRRSSSGPCERKVVYPADAIKAGLLPKDWGQCLPCRRPGLPVKLPPQTQGIKPGTNLPSYSKAEIGNLGGQFVPA